MTDIRSLINISPILKFYANPFLNDTGYIYCLKLNFINRLFHIITNEVEYIGYFSMDKEVIYLQYSYKMIKSNLLLNPESMDIKTEKINFRKTIHYSLIKLNRTHYLLGFDLTTTYALKISKNLLEEKGDCGKRSEYYDDPNMTIVSNNIFYI